MVQDKQKKLTEEVRQKRDRNHFFGLLYEVDKRENPHLYEDNDKSNG